MAALYYVERFYLPYLYDTWKTFDEAQTTAKFLISFSLISKDQILEDENEQTNLYRCEPPITDSRTTGGPRTIGWETWPRSMGRMLLNGGQQTNFTRSADIERKKDRI